MPIRGAPDGCEDGISFMNLVSWAGDEKSTTMQIPVLVGFGMAV